MNHYIIVLTKYKEKGDYLIKREFANNIFSTENKAKLSAIELIVDRHYFSDDKRAEKIASILERGWAIEGNFELKICEMEVK